jgi:predicted heme/steroid binding protein/uncharacterized membrane protein
MDEYVREDLENHDGKEGRSAFAAVDGKIYDLSSSGLWKDGEHMGQHSAGQDLSEAIVGAPHGKEVLDRVEQIGVLKAEAAPAAHTPPSWALRLLKWHPHPVSVHFPQALFAFAPIFLILFYLFGNPNFERTGFYLLIAGWITAIPAFKTGIFHWVFKHGKSTKPVYLFKLCGSILLLAYSAVVIYVHHTKGVLPPESVDIVMLVLYLLLLPVIVSLGHAGGKIVFG